ncbi:NAD(P)/FAD-dependent oxidoreductase [Moritella viscosa]|uniref:NADH dehydrogenase n=1 Tax=Moritella viscosa TaxID=80854 RepID=A0A1L0D614_9GAMM|nr:NAD(P)/FAD-dependent oxidoreductase [Moritella viscosa]SGY81833.1 NADH dehydrogenase [Moritella viscosa]SGY81888.1 NADH dehydrogenase [Moritella viscosa]SHN96134.1 NADH dehydrogenase [Moritella viscosa]SHN96137.1 NADH dehydrogenase [Moritella viscosa]SHN96250.1 NADH dehydrogenase [Moritella viscosa]
MKKILVIGGGAGGLELATQLGRKLGKKGKASITLVDRNKTHLWKPLLHEVATGSLDTGIDALSYAAHAKNQGFDFQLGNFSGLDRDTKTVTIAPLYNDCDELLIAERTLQYDYLVLAIGSMCNDFNTKGVKENCIFLDSPDQAHRFHKALLNQFLLHGANKAKDAKVNIAIVGAGATGVELSAELHNTASQLSAYGFTNVNQESLNVTLVEAGKSILPALPSRISAAAHHELTKIGVDVRTETMVTEANSEGLVTKNGDTIPASLMVWAAGIKAPDFMKDIAGLETNRINQIVVKGSLQASRDDSIFVIGDLASCAQADGSFVPPRAQAAHQMATIAFKNIVTLIQGGSRLKPFVYHDHGSLVSLSGFSTVGSLMGNLTKGSMMVEGRIARMVYISLYRMHQVALHGYVKTGLMMLVGSLNRVLRPTLKLH